MDSAIEIAFGMQSTSTAVDWIYAQSWAQPTRNPEAPISKCTAEDPSERFQDCDSLARAFDGYFAGVDSKQGRAELEDLLLRGAMGEKLNDSEQASLLELLSNSSSDTDLIHDALMKIAPSVFADLVAKDGPQCYRLVQVFVSHITSQGWGFSYTDSIGAQCQKLYMAVQESGIRALLGYCICEVGASHNRFAVLEIAGKILKGQMEPGEAEAMADLIKEFSPGWKESLLAYVGDSQIPECLVEALS